MLASNKNILVLLIMLIFSIDSYGQVGTRYRRSCPPNLTVDLGHNFNFEPIQYRSCYSLWNTHVKFSVSKTIKRTNVFGLEFGIDARNYKLDCLGELLDVDVDYAQFSSFTRHNYGSFFLGANYHKCYVKNRTYFSYGLSIGSNYTIRNRLTVGFQPFDNSTYSEIVLSTAPKKGPSFGFYSQLSARFGFTSNGFVFGIAPGIRLNHVSISSVYREKKDTDASPTTIEYQDQITQVQFSTSFFFIVPINL